MELTKTIGIMNNFEERNSFLVGSANTEKHFNTETFHDIANSLQENLQKSISQSFKKLEEVSDHNSLISTSSTDEDSEEYKNEIIGSLCRSIAPSIRELSAKLNEIHIDTQSFETQFQTPNKQNIRKNIGAFQFNESSVNLQHMIVECRKTLLDCSTALTAAAVASKGKRMTSMKVLTNSAFPLLQSGATEALKISEYLSNQEMINKTASPVFEMLDILERSAAVASRNVFLNLKLFGMRLATFLELAVLRMKDLRSNIAKMNIIAQSDTLKKLLPVIIQTLPSCSSLTTSNNSLLNGTNRQLFFNLARVSINKILESFHFEHHNNHIKSSNVSSLCTVGFVEPGNFIKNMDHILETLNNHNLKMNDRLFTDVQSSADYIIQFALSIAKLSSQIEECDSVNKEIMSACRNVISEMESLKMSFAKTEDQNYYNEIKLGREVVGDFVEILEQTVNSSLLSMIIKSYTLAHLPLDKLILSVSLDKDDEVIDEMVNQFDKTTDTIFQIAHLSTLCCTDKKRSQSINSSLHFMEALEKEIVPACLGIRPNTNSDGLEEKNHLKCLRQLWKNEVDSLEESLMGIVDPTAFCLLAEREISSCAKIVRNSAYTQNSEFLRNQLMKLIKVSKSVVDFCWKIERDNSKHSDKSRINYLEENNPIVKVERSIWEVEAATALTLQNIDDLNLHKSLLKRVQVVVTSIKDLVHCLMEDSSGASDNSNNKEPESMPVSMIKILKNESTITRTASLNKYESTERKLNPDNLTGDNIILSTSQWNNSRGTKSPVKVLTSISRIIIGEDCVTSIINENCKSSAPQIIPSVEKIHQSDVHLSKHRNKSKIKPTNGNKSFRNITLKSAIKSNARNKSNKLQTRTNPVRFDLIDQTMQRLSQSIEPLMPFSTRARQENNATTNTIYYTPKANLSNYNSASVSKKFPLAIPNEFDLSQILNKLTLLSHELSLSLQNNSHDIKTNDDPLVNKETSEIIMKETEELKSINDSIASVSCTATNEHINELSSKKEPCNDNFSGKQYSNATNTHSNICTVNAVIEHHVGNSSGLNERRMPLKSIGNKGRKGSGNAPNSNQKLAPVKSNRDVNTNQPKLEIKHDSSRVKEEIKKYAAENSIVLSTPERKKDVEEMDKRIAALLKINS